MVETQTDLSTSTSDETKKAASINDSWNFILSESVLVAAIPLLAYLVIFTFERGYLSVFGIPHQFISFDLAEIVGASGALLFSCFILFSLLNTVATFFLWLKFPRVLAHKITSYTPFLVFLIANLLFFRFTLLEWLSFSFLLTILLISDFIYPLFAYRNIKTYLGKLARANEIMFRTIARDQSPLAKLFRLIGKNRIKIIVYFVIFLYLTFRTGQSNALNRADYFTLKTNPDAVVLYISRDQAIIAPFNRSTKELEPEFTIVEFSQNPNISFRKEKLGPLLASPNQNFLLRLP